MEIDYRINSNENNGRTDYRIEQSSQVDSFLLEEDIYVPMQPARRREVKLHIVRRYIGKPNPLLD